MFYKIAVTTFEEIVFLSGNKDLPFRMIALGLAIVNLDTFKHIYL